MASGMLRSTLSEGSRDNEGAAAAEPIAASARAWRNRFDSGVAGAPGAEPCTGTDAEPGREESPDNSGAEVRAP